MIPILTILCGLAVVFAGGCAITIISFGSLPMAVIPGGIVALNVLVILAIWRRRPPSFGAFRTLAVIDLLLAYGLYAALNSLAKPVKPDELFFFRGAVALAVVLLLKGMLTLAAAARLRREPPPDPASGDAPQESTDGIE